LCLHLIASFRKSRVGASKNGITIGLVMGRSGGRESEVKPLKYANTFGRVVKKGEPKGAMSTAIK